MRRGILAWLGDKPDAHALDRAAHRFGLRCVRADRQLRVYAGQGLPIRSTLCGEFLLGDIFSRSGVTCLTPSDGWGNYLAFASTESAVSIDRAPLTGMPLYWTRNGSGVLCASHLALLHGLAEFTGLDREFIGHSLSYVNLRTERTGIASLFELLPGTKIEFDGCHVTTKSFWSPWPHVAKMRLSGVSELAPELERRINGAVRSWSDARPHILLELSGGLDSSIVAAALSAAGASYDAINFNTVGADGDERHYARAVADRHAIQLAEVQTNDDQIDLVAPPRLLQPRPGAYGVLGGLDQAFEDAFGNRQCSIFGGIGGDNIFDFDSSVSPILDAFAMFGYSRRTFTAMRDVARASEATLWQAAQLSLRAKRAGVRKSWPRETKFCNQDMIPDRPFAHPWDEGADAASRGKRRHVEALRRILDFVDRPERWQNRDVVYPLLSQPVVEYCLSIPSWAWFTGGRDRAVARAAYAQRLPPDVVWRKGKGRLESICTAAYLRQKSQLRDLLLDGWLASNGFLDRPVIETYFTEGVVAGDHDYFRLMEIADLERWVRAAEPAVLSGRSSAHR